MSDPSRKPASSFVAQPRIYRTNYLHLHGNYKYNTPLAPGLELLKHNSIVPNLAHYHLRMEGDLQKWAKQMGVLSGIQSETFKKLCERQILWEEVVKYVRPTHEVEHIRKTLALKKMSQKRELQKKLAEKEDTIKMKEQDFKQIHHKLQMLAHKQQTIKQERRELNMKSILLIYKEQDLIKKMKLHEELCKVVSFFQEPIGTGSADANKYTETVCEDAVRKCKEQVRELHMLCKTEGISEKSLHDKKESVMDLVQEHTKNLPPSNIWHMSMTSLDKVYKELVAMVQNSTKSDSESLLAMKKHIENQMTEFMKLYLEVSNTRHRLHQKMSLNTSECDSLINNITDLLKAKKYCKNSEEYDEIEKWLKLETQCVELDEAKETLQSFQKNKKVTSSSRKDTSLQLQEIEKLAREIERLKADIKTNYGWFKNSYRKQSEEQDKANRQISELSAVAQKKCNIVAVGATLKTLKGALQQDMKLFMNVPLHMLQNITLPSGRVLSSKQQVLRYNHFLESETHSREFNDLIVLDGAPAIAPHAVLFKILEKKLYLSSLQARKLHTDVCCEPLGDFCITSLKNMENVVAANISGVVNSINKSVEDCRAIASRAEYNLSFWVEHPLRFAVPHKLQIDGKSFKEWQRDYDNMLRYAIPEDELCNN